MTLIFHVLSVSLKLNKWVKSVSPAALRSLYTLICSLGVPVGANLHLSPHYWSFILVITTESFFFSFFLTTRVLFCFSHCFLNGKGSPFFLFPRVCATTCLWLNIFWIVQGNCYIILPSSLLWTVKSVCFFSPYFVMVTSNFPTLCILWSICIQQWNKYVYIFYDDATCASIAHISNSFSKPMCHQSNYLMLLTVAAISYIAQLALQLEVQSRGESVCG